MDFREWTRRPVRKQILLAVLFSISFQALHAETAPAVDVQDKAKISSDVLSKLVEQKIVAKLDTAPANIQHSLMRIQVLGKALTQQPLNSIQRTDHLESLLTALRDVESTRSEVIENVDNDTRRVYIDAYLERFDQLKKMARSLESATDSDVQAQIIAELLEVVGTYQADESDTATEVVLTNGKDSIVVSATGQNRRRRPEVDVNKPTFTSKHIDPIPETSVEVQAPRVSYEPGPGASMYAALDSFVAIDVGSPLSPPAGVCNFTMHDMGLPTSQPETEITQEISELAKKLGYSPARILEFVSNNIAFEPYYGSLKGGQGALKSGAGNATDQASLAIALLRASNIPARYVKGVVKVSGPEALNWLGVRSYKAGANVLTRGWVPADYGPDYIKFSHVWVEACVPYLNYRGTRGDESGHRWVPLDPSYEKKSYQAGIAIDVAFDYESYLSSRTHALPHEQFEREVEAFIRSKAPRFSNNVLADVPYAGKLIPQTFDILPAALPYTVTKYLAWSGSSSAEASVLPEEHRYKAFIQIRTQEKGGKAEISDAGDLPRQHNYVLDMPRIALKRLTLDFERVTGEGQDEIEAEFNRQYGETSLWFASGEIMYSLKYRNAMIACGWDYLPRLRVDGELYDISQDPVPTCTHWLYSSYSTQPSVVDGFDENAHYKSMRISLRLNGATVQKVLYSNISPHDLHALQIYSFQASDEVIEDRSSRLLAAIKSKPDLTENKDETLGEFLHLVGLKYMRNIDDAGKSIGRLNHKTGLSGNHIGLTASRQVPSYIFNLPYGISDAGFKIDVRGGSSRSLDIETGEPSFETFLLTGYASSAYESYVWQENARMDAVSSVTGIQYANDVGIEVLHINKANKESELSRLQVGEGPLSYSPKTKNDITSLIDSGYDVRIPASLISYGDWTGQVFIASRKTSDDDYEASFSIGPWAGGYAVNTIPDQIFYSSLSNSGWQYLTGSPICLTCSDKIIRAEPFLNNVVNYGGENGQVTSRDPVNMVNGNMYHTERDIQVKGIGLPLVFERTYNSMSANQPDASSKPLGYGWTHSFNHYLEFSDDDHDGESTAGDEDGRTSAVIWTGISGGKRSIGVTASETGVAAGAEFATPEGFYFTVSKDIDGKYRVKEKNGLTYVFNEAAGQVGDKALLSRIEDRYGNALQLTYAAGSNNLEQVTDGLGHYLDLTYNSDNQIEQVRDWTGRVFQYQYNTEGELKAYLDPDAVAGKHQGVQYTYYGTENGENLNHQMRSFASPTGNKMTFEYYADGKAFRHTDNDDKSMSFRYNEFRRETISIDERGFHKIHYFDKNGNPTAIVDENGGRWEYKYDPVKTHNRTAVTNPLGLVTGYDYDDRGNVVKVTKPSGATVEYGYFNAYNQPGKVKDENGNYTLYKYDAQGNRTQVIRLKKGEGSTLNPFTENPAPSQIAAWTLTDYNGNGQPTRIKRIRDFSSQEGPVVELAYGDGLNVTKITRCGDQDGDGSTDPVSECQSATQSYDSLGRLISGTDGSWYTIGRQYDDLGRTTRSTDSQNQWRDFTYDATGNVLSQELTVDRGGVPTRLDQSYFTYDTRDRLQTSVDAGGAATRYRYDALGNVVKVTDPDGYSTGIEYDAMNRPIKAFDQEGHAVSKELDLIGRPRTITDPNGNSTTFKYYGPEENGRLQRRTDAAGRFVEFEYDSAGNVTTITDNLGRQTHTQYDALNRAVRIVGPVHADTAIGDIRQVTRYQYDSLGNLVQVLAGYTTDISGLSDTADSVLPQSIATYDDFGRKRTETDPLGHVIRYAYDDHDNLIEVIDAKNQKKIFTYGYGGRLDGVGIYRHKDDATPEQTIGYSYNALGQRTRVISQDVTYTYHYDPAHRLASVTDSRGPKRIEYRYSPGGMLNAMIDSEGNQTDYLYDAVGRLTGIWAPNGDLVSYVRDPGGRVTEKWFPNGVSAQYEYNPDNSIKRVVNRVDGSFALSKHEYTYDDAGNRERLVETLEGAVRTYQYQYDPLDRLTKVLDGAGGSIESLSYDPYNNRRTQTNDSGTRYFSYDDAQQLNKIRENDGLGAVLATFQYDNNGNLTSKTEGDDTLTLSYDARDRMVSAQAGALPAELYTYDHSGRRISKALGGQVTNYVYAGPDVVASYGDDWYQAEHVVTHGPGMDDPLIMTDGNGQAGYFHQDGLGSVVAYTDMAGGISGKSRYDAWGNISEASGEIPLYGYTGREHDVTGLLYYRARYYDPSVGRFTQRDPKGFVDGINRYAYAINNPINYVDPWGTSANPFSGNQPHLSSSARRILSGEGNGSYWGGIPSASTYDSGSDASFVLDNIPFVGTGKAIIQVGTGTDLVTGEPVHRGWEAGGILLGLVPAGRLLGDAVGAAVNKYLKYGPNDPPVRIEGNWSESDMKQALLGHPPQGLGKPDLHHADQMPGSAIHEIPPELHRGNQMLHQNKFNQGVTPEMRDADRRLHWWYRAREQGADEVLPNWIYD